MSSPFFHLRTPVATDAPALADLHVATWREAYAHLLPLHFFSDEYVRGRHDIWSRLLGHPRPEFAIRLAETDGELTGFGWAGPGVGADGAPPPRDRQLYAIYVRASAYGTGMGQALLDAVLPAGPAMLWVAQQNPRAIAFYRRNGFEFDGTHQVDPAAPSITDARMVR